MPKFRVLIHGENYRIRRRRRKFLFFKQTVSTAAGFYTTRFVEAESADEAFEKVLKIVKIETETDGRATERSTLKAAEIEEDEEAFDLYAPGGGFTFYVETDE
jgi:hypothetical protein